MNTTITPVRPACFKSIGEFANWLAATKRTGMPKSGYCTDCTPAYQREMLKVQRCGHPGVTFSIDDDGFIEGKRLKQDRRTRSEAARLAA
jgi:hypothetical protein